jgi:hypothetical protein
MMGSLLSVGDHMYIDRKHALWKKAVLGLIRVMNDIKLKSGAAAVQLRDIDTADTELSEFFIKEGLIKIEMPDTHVLCNARWESEEEYMMERLSTKARWHFRRNILGKRDLYNITLLTGRKSVDSKRVAEWRQLYRNVKDKSLNINTYALPEKYFTNIINHHNWEVIELRLKPEPGENAADKPLVAVGFCYLSSKNNYSIMAVGMDYNYVLSHSCYRQSLYQSVVRANELKCEKLYLGMDASIEKRKFGVNVIQKSVFVQASDNFNMEMIGSVYSHKQNITRQDDLKSAEKVAA